MCLKFLDFGSHAAVYLVFVLIDILTHELISHDHTWHCKLAETMVAFSRRPSPSPSGEETRMVGQPLNNILKLIFPSTNPGTKTVERMLPQKPMRDTHMIFALTKTLSQVLKSCASNGRGAMLSWRNWLPCNAARLVMKSMPL